jgi:glycosyltransferase involved in cell wall biosynthesis
MLPDIYYGIAAYNEENNILDCLASLDAQTVDARVETLICLNGCTDNTLERTLEGQRRYPGLHVTLLHSKKAKTFAQNAIASAATNREVPITFIDCDVTLEPKCVDILIKDISTIDTLIVAGAWPVPLKQGKLTPWQQFMFDTLHARAFYPRAEVAVNDVSAYKSFAHAWPQPTLAPESEVRSKIYFHGRTFMMRNANYFFLPTDVNVTDDTYIPNSIHTKYGPGTIRTRFDAIAYYKPYLSLREHFRTYRRIFLDLETIDRSEQFVTSRMMEKTRLDWEYIRSEGWPVLKNFLAYTAISQIEGALFRTLEKKKPSDLWVYEHK